MPPVRIRVKMHAERRINLELAVRKAKPLKPIRSKLLSRKLFENVNSLFANESEVGLAT
jgi:hypothetical protein